MNRMIHRAAVFSAVFAALLAAALQAGCSPKFDWRDYRSEVAPYAILFPAKPATQSRPVNLGGEPVTMHMAAADIDGATFAVGSAEMTDPAQAQAAITAMKTAMTANINATITSEKQSNAGGQIAIDIEAKGSRNGEPLLLIGHFVAKEKRVYQVIVVGREKHLVKDAVDTFMSSFKLN